MNNLFANVPKDIKNNLFGIMGKEGTNFKEVVNILGLDKNEIAKAARISEQSVRYDSKMPANLEKFLNELIVILSLVAGHFGYDKDKTLLWFRMPNSLLGGISPIEMIIIGKYKKLHKFIIRSLDGDMP